jgi:hypothetical protein
MSTLRNVHSGKVAHLDQWRNDIRGILDIVYACRVWPAPLSY